MRRIVFKIVKIGERIFPIQDLGNNTMNSQFLKLYESYCSTHSINITNNFEDETLKFFDQYSNNSSATEGFFNNFTILWQNFIEQKHFKNAEHLWGEVLKIVYKWENENKRIHKGTPYYFWGVTCILNGDLEKGFLLMHQALEEDKEAGKTNTPNTPAYAFVTLDYEKQNQFFRPKVEEIAKFVEKKLNAYRSSRKGTLTLSDFKSRFLEKSDLLEVVFYFVFASFHLKKLLKEVDQRVTQNVFSSLLQANTIFDLCLIVENTIKKQNKYRNKNLNGQTIGPILEFLSSKSLLNLHKKDNLKNLKDDFENGFSKTVQRLLDSQYHFQNGTTPKPIEEDLAVTYGFRNFGAHKIEGQPVVYQNFDKIAQRVLNALFFSIENLYQ